MKAAVEQNSPGAASSTYQRYVEAYEAHVAPRHHELQARFESYLRSCGASELIANKASVDLQYRDAKRGAVLAEIKPCDDTNARYAIRTAIGQLLDYRQRASEGALLLVVLETMPSEEDRVLATSNGFGVAYPRKSAFAIEWPTKARRSR